MTVVSYLVFKCLNPDCCMQIKLARPAKSGIYAVTCPHCGVKKQLRLKGLDAPSQQSDDKDKQTEDKVSDKIKDNSGKQIVELTDDFVVGVRYTIKCPHCNKQELGFVTDKAGHRAIPCPLCKGKIGVDVRNKTEVIVLSETLQLLRGKLVMLRKGWINKDFKLQEGINVIGRYDESSLSDISIKNDPGISRRSVEIEVKRTMKGYVFKLTVLKATNPVLHNYKPLQVGDSVSLNFGDNIVLGKTKFRFDKDK